MKAVHFINGPYDGLTKERIKDETLPEAVILPINRAVLFALMEIDVPLTETTTIAIYKLLQNTGDFYYIFHEFQKSTDDKWIDWCLEIINSI